MGSARWSTKPVPPFHQLVAQVPEVVRPHHRRHPLQLLGDDVEIIFRINKFGHTGELLRLAMATDVALRTGRARSVGSSLVCIPVSLPSTTAGRDGSTAAVSDLPSTRSKSGFNCTNTQRLTMGLTNWVRAAEVNDSWRADSTVGIPPLRCSGGTIRQTGTWVSGEPFSAFGGMGRL